jgi:hypothetical protein
MNLAQFEVYLSSCGDRLDNPGTNKAFSTLTAGEQEKFLDSINKRIMDSLRGIRADDIQVDNTNIAFSIRLCNNGAFWRRGPNRRIAGNPHDCYRNCRSSFDNLHNIYAGYALDQRPEDSYRKWVPHAWLVAKRTNRITEPTPGDWRAYFGVPVTSEELLY